MSINPATLRGNLVHLARLAKYWNIQVIPPSALIIGIQNSILESHQELHLLLQKTLPLLMPSRALILKPLIDTLNKVIGLTNNFCLKLPAFFQAMNTCISQLNIEEEEGVGAGDYAASTGLMALFEEYAQSAEFRILFPLITAINSQMTADDLVYTSSSLQPGSPLIISTTSGPYSINLSYAFNNFKVNADIFQKYLLLCYSVQQLFEMPLNWCRITLNQTLEAPAMEHFVPQSIKKMYLNTKKLIRLNKGFTSPLLYLSMLMPTSYLEMIVYGDYLVNEEDVEQRATPGLLKSMVSEFLNSPPAFKG